jgi:hypothetical protein
MQFERETVPCDTCGQPTPYKGTRRCDNCWEVESRLAAYLESEKGREFIKQAFREFIKQALRELQRAGRAIREGNFDVDDHA